MIFGSLIGLAFLVYIIFAFVLIFSSTIGLIICELFEFIIDEITFILEDIKNFIARR